MSDFRKVEGHTDLIKDMHSKAVINTNRSAYLDCSTRKKTFIAQQDSIRDATREINILKSEMHEIKSLLVKLVEKMAIDKYYLAIRLKNLDKHLIQLLKMWGILQIFLTQLE